ncbi:MAG: hypothetical protein ABEI97_04545 [Candidatus Nanohaloarchaea archaeon]
MDAVRHRNNGVGREPVSSAVYGLADTAAYFNDLGSGAEVVTTFIEDELAADDHYETVIEHLREKDGELLQRSAARDRKELMRTTVPRIDENLGHAFATYEGDFVLDDSEERPVANDHSLGSVFRTAIAAVADAGYKAIAAGRAYDEQEDRLDDRQAREAGDLETMDEAESYGSRARDEMYELAQESVQMANSASEALLGGGAVHTDTADDGTGVLELVDDRLTLFDGIFGEDRDDVETDSVGLGTLVDSDEQDYDNIDRLRTWYNNAVDTTETVADEMGTLLNFSASDYDATTVEQSHLGTIEQAVKYTQDLVAGVQDAMTDEVYDDVRTASFGDGYRVGQQLVGEDGVVAGDDPVNDFRRPQEAYNNILKAL